MGVNIVIESINNAFIVVTCRGIINNIMTVANNHHTHCQKSGCYIHSTMSTLTTYEIAKGIQVSNIIKAYRMQLN